MFHCSYELALRLALLAELTAILATAGMKKCSGLDFFTRGEEAEVKDADGEKRE